MTFFPRSNLPNPSVHWGRTVEGAIDGVESRVEQLDIENINTNKQQNSSIKAVQENVEKAQIAIDRLEAISQSAYIEFSVGITGSGVGFLVSPGDTSLIVPTGHLKLTYGGSLNSGQGYYVYQVTATLSGTIMSRSTVQANPAQRVAITGGASFTPSGSTSVLLNVPKDELITVSLELYSGLAGSYFAGGSLLAEVAP